MARRTRPSPMLDQSHFRARRVLQNLHPGSRGRGSKALRTF
jgi:hypothetical protein